MFISHAFSRLTNYYRRHGFSASMERARLFARQALTSGKMVVLYWDLTSGGEATDSAHLPEHLTVERKNSREEIEADDWNLIISFWNPKLTEPAFSLRLQQGATIWLLRSEGKLAGYMWSVAGRTLEPYYYPLGAGDAVVYDFLVFPEYRGRRSLPHLLNYVLTQIRAEKMSRAHFDVATWNRASLSSTARTAYTRHMMGIARKTTFFGRTFVQWLPLPPVEAERFQVLAKLVTSA